MIFIFSTSRSGSSWLGKIFDSHPGVLYLHEPDIEDRGLDLMPFWFETAPTDVQTDAARLYLNRLATARSPRATGTRPFFGKNYRGPVGELSRRALIYAAKASERAGMKAPSNWIQIPDLANSTCEQISVLKSVSALGRAEALIRAAGSKLRPILLIRHPCGYAHSMLRGSRMGVMTHPSSLGRLLDTRTAHRLHITPSALANADEVENLVWGWLLGNVEAQTAVAAAGGATVVYETLASDALGGAKELFSQVGLSWSPQTDAFLHNATQRKGGYYSVFRDDALLSANRWRTELDAKTIDRIRSIVTRDDIGRLFFAP